MRSCKGRHLISTRSHCQALFFDGLVGVQVGERHVNNAVCVARSGASDGRECGAGEAVFRTFHAPKPEHAGNKEEDGWMDCYWDKIKAPRQTEALLFSFVPLLRLERRRPIRAQALNLLCMPIPP